MPNTDSKTRKVLTMLDVVTFVYSEWERYEESDLVRDFANYCNISVDLAESMVTAAENLGYIDEHDCTTDKARKYIEACSSKRDSYGTLTLIRGLPGAGKTSLARTIVSDKKSRGAKTVIHLEADLFMVDNEGNYKFELEKVRLCNTECIAKAEYYLHMGWDVVVSNSFPQYWEVKPYYDIAAKPGIKTTLIDMQSQYTSENRSARTRQQMIDKWENVFLPRNWNNFSQGF